MASNPARASHSAAPTYLGLWGAGVFLLHPPRFAPCLSKPWRVWFFRGRIREWALVFGQTNQGQGSLHLDSGLYQAACGSRLSDYIRSHQATEVETDRRFQLGR